MRESSVMSSKAQVGRAELSFHTFCLSFTRLAVVSQVLLSFHTFCFHFTRLAFAPHVWLSFLRDGTSRLRLVLVWVLHVYGKPATKTVFSYSWASKVETLLNSVLFLPLPLIF
jgi:hypothetical protein